MLEDYFSRPTTVDRIRNGWLGEPIEQYVTWLSENNYAARSVFSRVPLVSQFGDFAQNHGVTSWQHLPVHVDGFVKFWVKNHSQWCQNAGEERSVETTARNVVEQFLRIILPGYQSNSQQQLPDPFTTVAPGFFDYLHQERGLQQTTVAHYRYHLRGFEHYLSSINLVELQALSIPVVSAFVTELGTRVCKNSVRYPVGVLRVFLGYLYREKMITEDLGRSVEGPKMYRLATLPRSISWEEVRLLLANVDRRSAVGKRDYALLLLLVTYGLRAREIAALTLDLIDWKRERLLIPERKAGHTTAYPLSTVVGDAIIDYLQNGRPKTNDRALFFRAIAPYSPLTWVAISQRAAHHIRSAGIQVHRAGAQTLRHTCVQRLIDAELPLKTIGDYVGHRSPDATNIYTKVAIEALRQVALGDGEKIL